MLIGKQFPTASSLWHVVIYGYSTHKNIAFVEKNNLKNNECTLSLLLLSYVLLFSTDMGILAVLALPLVILGISGIIYIYQSVIWLLSQSAVQNKVVVITDAISRLGNGELSLFFSVSGNTNGHRSSSTWFHVHSLPWAGCRS